MGVVSDIAILESFDVDYAQASFSEKGAIVQERLQAISSLEKAIEGKLEKDSLQGNLRAQEVHIRQCFAKDQMKLPGLICFIALTVLFGAELATRFKTSYKIMSLSCVACFCFCQSPNYQLLSQQSFPEQTRKSHLRLLREALNPPQEKSVVDQLYDFDDIE